MVEAAKKYEFTGETHWFTGSSPAPRLIRRIRRLSDGAIGGWLQHEGNLDQDGGCWVADNAIVYGAARVYDDAQIYGRARVYGAAHVYDNARVCGSAQVYDNALVFGSACVYGDAHVFDDAHVSDSAQVYGSTRVANDAIIEGDCRVGGGCTIGGASHLRGSVHVHSSAVGAILDIALDGDFDVIQYTRGVLVGVGVCARGGVAAPVTTEEHSVLAPVSGRVARVPRRRRQ